MNSQIGYLGSGGRVDLERVSRIVINKLRAGMLGPLGFETPEVMEVELEKVAIIKSEKCQRGYLHLEKAVAPIENPGPTANSCEHIKELIGA